MRERHAQESADGRDIGSIPDIADVDRRESCRLSLRLFCEVYNPEPLYYDWSSDHLKAIARIEEAVLHGALFAFAMPRGSGKSTLCRMACLWALAYAHRRYVYLIGSNAGKAEESLDTIKVLMRFLPEFAADFPEIAYPIDKIGGIAHRCKGQTCERRSTMIEWTKSQVVLPTVPVPANWRDSWPHDDGMAPSGGSIIGVSGLTGDGIRGSLHTLVTGEMIRPDLVVLDDPQTDESSASITQNTTRERLIAGAVLGMAGPGRTISAVMPCTVIRPDDMVDRILDREKHPMWRGERTRMLRTMPSDMSAWEKYFEVYRSCASKEPPDFSDANTYYEQNRTELDKGADPSWPQRKLEGDVSAIQHAMNIYCRDPLVFFAEYQNEPRLSEEASAPALTADEVASKVNRLRRGLVPIGCETMTAFIDVMKDSLYWAVCAWSDDFTGYIVDYGTHPEQGVGYYQSMSLKKTLGMSKPSAGEEGAIYAGLESLCGKLIGRAWKRDDGAESRISRCLIDANWGAMTELVYQFCRQSAHAGVVMPSHGKFFGASSVSINDWAKKPGDRVGHYWRIPRLKTARGIRHVVYDTNYWKSFTVARFAMSMGDSGGLSLFGSKPSEHRLFADHMTAEVRVPTEARGRVVDEWKIRPQKPDNHWFDCVVGCAVAASMTGCKLRGIEMRDGRRSRDKMGRVKLSDLKKKK